MSWKAVERFCDQWTPDRRDGFGYDRVGYESEGNYPEETRTIPGRVSRQVAAHGDKNFFLTHRIKVQAQKVCTILWATDRAGVRSRRKMWLRV